MARSVSPSKTASASASSVCPACRNPACDAGTRCKPPEERRVEGDRRETERRFFPRPEGRRKGLGRRVTDLPS
jgi:hypothetical protein